MNGNCVSDRQERLEDDWGKAWLIDDRRPRLAKK
jgi:hypothetical protein